MPEHRKRDFGSPDRSSIVSRKAIGESVIAVGLVLGVTTTVIGLWYILEWQLVPSTPDERREIFVLMAQVMGGALILSGIFFTWRRLSVAEETLRISQEGQVTERFTRAMDQLGSNKLVVRLGGIYSLERIARESKKDHWPIMEVLTKVLQVEAARKSENFCLDGEQENKMPEPHIQAILTILERRNLAHEGEDQKLELHNVDLRGGYLREVNFAKAHLQGSDLRTANLEKANFYGTQLAGANLRKANLGYAVGLTREQLMSAYSYEGAILPQELIESEPRASLG